MSKEVAGSEVELAVKDLCSAEVRASLSSRIELCYQCLELVTETAMEWAGLATEAKGLARTSPLIAEDLLSGPAVVARQLQLTIQTLRSIDRSGTPTLPANPVTLKNGQISAPVFPTVGLFDSLTFMGIRASIRLQPEINEANVHGQHASAASRETLPELTAILGAGNVSSIPATDSLNRIMFEGSRVLLKLNPVNEYLLPVFERVFAPLIRAKLLRVLKGGADVGEAMIHHPAVDEVHITGSAATHDAIVWGRDPAERSRRRQAGDPLLKKKVTSELGNVTPWIIVPGQYSVRQLDSQARHIAASITNNASFNCLATKMIITWSRWPQRDEFLRLIQKHLSETPIRPAYYPGAVDRFQRFTGTRTSADDRGCLPWTLLTGQSAEERPELFQEESFVCVCGETALAAETPKDFLQAATDFVNYRMAGTLCASMTLPSDFRRRHQDAIERSLTRLRYGTVCVNQWSGIAYGLTSPPWGAYPGASIQNVESGIGNVHNTYLLDGIEKTVLQGPLVNFPKPVWFSTHRNAVEVATRLIHLYHRSSMFSLPSLFAAAITG